MTKQTQMTSDSQRDKLVLTPRQIDVAVCVLLDSGLLTPEAEQREAVLREVAATLLDAAFCSEQRI